MTRAAAAADVFTANKELSLRERREGRLFLESKPTRLELIVTNWCNLKCVMCPPSRYAGGYVLPQGVFAQIEALAPTLERLGWQGGEFFHLAHVKKFFETLRSAAPHVRHQVTTNGLLLTEDWVRLLLDAGAAMQFSIDSPLEGPYERIRRGGRFADLVKNLRLIQEVEGRENRRLDRGLLAVVMRSNHAHLEEYAAFIEEFGFRRAGFCQVQHFHDSLSGAEENIFADPALDYGRLNAARDFLRERCAALGVELSWNLPAKAPAASERPNEEGDWSIHPWEGMWLCGDRGGEVHPYCGSNVVLGSVRESPILDVWNGARMQQYRSMELQRRNFTGRG